MELIPVTYSSLGTALHSFKPRIKYIKIKCNRTWKQLDKLRPVFLFLCLWVCDQWCWPVQKIMWICCWSEDGCRHTGGVKGRRRRRWTLSTHLDVMSCCHHSFQLEHSPVGSKEESDHPNSIALGYWATCLFHEKQSTQHTFCKCTRMVSCLSAFRTNKTK